LVSSYRIGDYQAGEGCCLLNVRKYRPAGNRRGCLWFWGRGNQSWQATDAVYWNGLQRKVAEAGTPVASGDFGSPTHWGNGTSVTRTEQLRLWQQTAQNVKTDKVVLLAVSMGALAALNWARQYPTRVAAIALLTPIVNLGYYHDVYSDGGVVSAQIDAAYGGSAAYAAAAPTSDPMLYGAQLSGIPMKVWYSTDDPSVRPQDATAFASLAGADIKSLGAVGHSAGYLDFSSLDLFLNQHRTG
jgi:pimeloyl-ACP methyl ester carboxylesterase